MWNSVSRLTNKPAVLVAVSVVGCFMLWLACKQVKSTVDMLVHLQVLTSSQINTLPDKPRYCLFGVLALVYVWLDLVILKMLLHLARIVVRLGQRMLRARFLAAGDKDHDADTKTESAEPVRKNPMRACRGVNKRFMFDD